jgi:precorrin-6A/cobalt-precorrin-6A reductase
MRILILGGIGEALRLSIMLSASHNIFYSVAGKGRIHNGLSYKMHVGGFGGGNGLANFLCENNIELLIDATHPFAAKISKNAELAASLSNCPLWSYRRLEWQPGPNDNWIPVAGWPAIVTEINRFRRPFFTIGLEPLHHSAEIPIGQEWLVRCLSAVAPTSPHITLLCATGPFSLDQETALMRDYHTDVLVTKNSGGNAVEAKLIVARKIGIRVVMLQRPALPIVDRMFTDIKCLADQLL